MNAQPCTVRVSRRGVFASALVTGSLSIATVLGGLVVGCGQAAPPPGATVLTADGLVAVAADGSTRPSQLAAPGELDGPGGLDAPPGIGGEERELAARRRGRLQRWLKQRRQQRQGTSTSSSGTNAPLILPRSGSPNKIEEIMAERDVERLANWAEDGGLFDEGRTVALCCLEALDSRRSVDAALRLVHAGARTLVRINAVAVLARSNDPRAQQALAGLDEETRRKAASIAGAQ